ncbi:MAG: VCBS repeat-containing protein [Myxococcota bacterium]
MFPLVYTLPLAGPLVTVQLAEVVPGAPRVIVSAIRPDQKTPTGVRLTVDQLLDGGVQRLADRSLPARAAWWDAGHGLWVLDQDGLHNLLNDDPPLSVDSLLGWVGAATPAHAAMVTDLDQDAVVELLLPTRGGYRVVGEDGVEWGDLSAAADGHLERQFEGGGQVLSVSLAPPPVVLVDVDGDALLDVLLVRDDGIEIQLTGPKQVRQRQVRWPMPAVLRETLADKGTWSPQLRWTDLTGDGRVDLLIHRVRTDGSLGGTEAELILLAGVDAPTGLAAPVRISTGAGSQEAHPVDFDNDGDLDVLVPQVSLALGNLAQAVISQSIDVELTLLPMSDGGLGAPRALQQMRLPLEGQRAAWTAFDDLSGDGRPDLAVASEGRLMCYRGQGMSVEEKPWINVALSSPVENLWAANLVGDDAAELVGWAPGARELTVIRLR